jgi:hypothetical protein
VAEMREVDDIPKKGVRMEIVKLFSLRLSFVSRAGQATGMDVLYNCSLLHMVYFALLL